MAVGYGLWTFIEYFLHRFLFHGEDYWLPDNPKMLAFHFFIHGIHHAFPMDHYRLVLPVLASYIAQAIVTAPMKLIIPLQFQPAIIVGFTLGYVSYDMIHYFLHHSQPAKGHLKNMK